MNLAVIIGVAKYNRPGGDLPACNNDINLVRALLSHTEKYQEIFELSTDTTSANIKGKLVSFVKKYQGKSIDELFFYYTGHGGLFDDKFYFLLTNYDEYKKEATSLSNNELDQMLRSLSPSLMVKFVDACNAGVMYVKDPDALTKHLEYSKKEFSNCYFMFSSHLNQSSYQDSHLSAFTEALIDACLSFQGNDIRFKDIIDSISDSFSGNRSQQPFFVTQCSFTEIFFKIDQSIKESLTRMAASYKKRPSEATVSPGSNSSPEKAREESQEQSLFSLVEFQAQQYCTQAEFLEYLQLLKGELKSAQFSGSLEKLYKLSLETHRVESETDFFISNRKSLGKWLKDNTADYFARPTYRSEIYEEEVLDYRTKIPALAAEIPKTKKVSKSREVLSGFTLTAEVPYHETKIVAQPLFLNIPYIVCVSTFIFSKKEIILFYCIHDVAESDWGKLAQIEEPNWRYLTMVIREDLDGAKTSRILLSKLQEFAEHVVRKKVGLEKDEPSKSKQ